MYADPRVSAMLVGGLIAAAIGAFTFAAVYRSGLLLFVGIGLLALTPLEITNVRRLIKDRRRE